MPMSKQPASPQSKEDPQRSHQPDGEEPGSNAVEHEPDAQAQPIPDGEHKYVKRSPYTAGND
jgi:hypothetical protein